LSQKERRGGKGEREKATKNRKCNSVNSDRGQRGKGEYIFHGGELFQTVRFSARIKGPYCFSFFFLFFFSFRIYPLSRLELLGHSSVVER